jgi:alpha-aminoadipic semialdehyde synthase
MSEFGKLGVIGIRKEDKSKWERRTSITPATVAKLLAEYPFLKFIVQPSENRIFRDGEYLKAGAHISEDLSECSTIFGVKEVPIASLIPNKTYVYFSHVIKAQEYNMPTLDEILQKKIRLVDYEKITDEAGQRLVAFGKFAGNAGCMDFLAGLGRYFLNLGFSTPFLNASFAYTYKNLEKGKEMLKDVGELIENTGVPKPFAPFIFAITGSGRCAEGVLEILKCLPIKIVDPDELPGLVNDKDNPDHLSCIYVTFITAKHMVKPLDPSKEFSKQEYYSSPEAYTPMFHEKYLPYISVIFHCMYWDQKFPRLITSAQIKELALAKNLRLFGVCDITCDLEGSIDFLKFFTSIDEPFFLFNPVTGGTSRNITERSTDILYQSVDYLPTELAYDSSTYFSEQLYPFIVNIATSDITKPIKEQNLVPEIERAMITWNGQLTKPFEYIQKLRKENEAAKKKSWMKENTFPPNKKGLSSISLKIIGHLFDTKAINEIFDDLEENKVSFRVLNMEIGQNNGELSEAEIQIFSKDPQVSKKTLETIYYIGEKFGLEIKS